jgi:hypothetical protein
MAESTTATALAVYLFTDKTAKAVGGSSGIVNTQLKQGVNGRCLAQIRQPRARNLMKIRGPLIMGEIPRSARDVETASPARTYNAGCCWVRQ